MPSRRGLMKVYTVRATCELAGLVARLAAGDPLSKKIIFCEDKFTLELELALADKYGGTFGTRVFTFNRFMHKYLPKSGEVLSPENAALVVKRLLLENKGDLTCFKNVYDPNLSSVVYELIAQLKSAKIAPTDILRAAEGSEGVLKRKLSDIYLIFDAYERFIAANGLTDGNNRLSRLPAFFSDSDEIKNADVIVAGFPSLNRTLCEIFKSLARNAKSLTFALVAGKNGGVYTNETFDFAMREFKPEHYEESGSEIKSRLLDVLFEPRLNGTSCGFYSGVHVYRAQSVVEEAEYVARLIASEVRNGENKDGENRLGASYKDYAVCAENISDYYPVLRRVFADYGLPGFFDTSVDLSKHPLTTLVCAYLDIFRRGFSLADYLRFVKNPIVIPDNDLSDAYENYLLKHSINKKTLFKPFTCEDERLEQFEAVRKFTTEILKSSVFYGVKRVGSTVFSFADAANDITAMLDLLNAETAVSSLGERVEELGKAELAAYNAQSYEKFCDTLTSANRVLGDKSLPLSEIKNVIVSGMTACKISVIQELSDCVFVGDFRSVKYKERPYLFVLGLNEGVPDSKLDSALLCDRDIAGMERFDLSVEPKIKEVNRRNRENACMAIAAFGKGLYISWSSRGADGDECKCSDIVGYVISAFSGKDDSEKIPIADAASNARSAEKIGGERAVRYRALPYMTERSAAFGFSREISAFKEGKSNECDAACAFYRVMQERDLNALPDGLLGSVNCELGYYTPDVNYAEREISATSVEGYFRCPYANFLSRGVRLGRRDETDMQSWVIGNLIHEVADEFTRLADFDGTKEAARTLAEELFDGISANEEYARYATTGSGKVAFKFLKKETVRFCLSVYDGCYNSMFRPTFTEVKFGRDGKMPALSVSARSGVRRITGKADRIDTYLDKMSVIDYKTGGVNGKDDELYLGKKLQLYLYAKAFSDKYSPVGAYYFPISDEYGVEQDAEMKMQGKTLADFQTASEIDRTIDEENRRGTFIAANLTEKKGGGFRYDGGLLTREEFDAYIDYAVRVASEGISEINEGVIIPSPDSKACEYCEYHGMCGYDGAVDGRTRSAGEQITKETILAAVGKNDGGRGDDGNEN